MHCPRRFQISAGRSLLVARCSLLVVGAQSKPRLELCDTVATWFASRAGSQAPGTLATSQRKALTPTRRRVVCVVLSPSQAKLQPVRG